jgi:hypothetical protein
MSIYEGVGERSFSISELRKIFTRHTRPFDGHQRCVAITPSFRYRSPTFGAEPKSFFNPILLFLPRPRAHLHTFRHLYRQ